MKTTDDNRPSVPGIKFTDQRRFAATVTSPEGTSHQLVPYFRLLNSAGGAYQEDVDAADQDATLGTSRS
jgi:hypothetical protein